MVMKSSDRMWMCVSSSVAVESSDAFAVEATLTREVTDLGVSILSGSDSKAMIRGRADFM